MVQTHQIYTINHRLKATQTAKPILEKLILILIIKQIEIVSKASNLSKIIRIIIPKYQLNHCNMQLMKFPKIHESAIIRMIKQINTHQKIYQII